MTKANNWLLWVILSATSMPSIACAQNPAGATEATQAMNFAQLLQLAYTAENQLRTAQTIVEQARFNMQRLSRGDVTAIRDSVNQAMMVQNMVSGYLATQRSVAQTLEYSYPSPDRLDGRFRTWQQYYQHMDEVERENHRTFTEAAQVIDRQLAQGMGQDNRLLQRLREKAGSADTEAKHLQVTNEILLELVRQMHLMRMEALSAHRMELLGAAAASQRRVAQEAATEQVLKPMRVGDPSQYPTYRIGVLR